MSVYTYDRLCLWPYTINFKCVFKYFPKIECPRALAWQCWAIAKLLPECSVGNRSGDGSSLRMHGTLLLVCHGSYGPTINGRLLAERPKTIHGGLRSQRLCINDTHKRSDSAYQFSVKLSLFMCMLAACSGSPPQCSTFSS